MTDCNIQFGVAPPKKKSKSKSKKSKKYKIYELLNLVANKI